MSVRIGLGIGPQPFASARAFFRWVDLCEASAVDSLWQTDRLASSEPYLEAMSTMAALAGATERIKFGMNAVVVTTRDPLVLAKQCATIDYLSRGRLLPVFGVGTETAPEWEATGRSPKGRGSRADEALEIMRRLWSEESVDFEGEHFRYRAASIAPRPVQQPLPLWIGGSSAPAIRRTARIGTGWLAGLEDPARIGGVVSAIKQAASDLGRKLADDHFGATIPFRLEGLEGRGGASQPPPGDGMGRALPSSRVAIGKPEEVIARCATLRRAGIHKFVMIPLARGDDDVFDQTRRLVEQVLPVVHDWD